MVTPQPVDDGLLRPGAGPRRRRLRIVLAVLAVLTAIGGVLAFATLRHPGGTTTGAGRPVPSSTTSRALRSHQHQGFWWQDVGGVRLPASGTHGPWVTTGTQAAGYSHSEKGAALAAAQVLMRSGASMGPDMFLSIMTTQMTGANVAALKLNTMDVYEQLRQTNPVPDGAPIPGADARILGYRIEAYTDATATVDVIEGSTSPAGAGIVLAAAVQLQWSYGSWRVVAPPLGDWQQIMTTLGRPPPGTLPYEEIG